MALHGMPALSHATAVVPDPANGSMTVTPSGSHLTTRSMTRSGIWHGWAVFSRDTFLTWGHCTQS